MGRLTRSAARIRRAARLRSRLARARASLEWVSVELWFYNLDNHRPDQQQVARELRAIGSRRPMAIGLCEAIGNHLPDLPGLELFRDHASRSRQNIAAYVRHDLGGRLVRWHDLKGTWPRTKGPGTHEPRSFAEFAIGWVQLIVGHQAPQNAEDSRDMQQEGVDAVVWAMTPWRRRGLEEARRFARMLPRLLAWDGNTRVGDGRPGPEEVARRIGGRVYGGWRIDHLIARGFGLEVTHVDKVREVVDLDTGRRVQLESDHGGAIRYRLRIRRFWLRLPHTPRKEHP